MRPNFSQAAKLFFSPDMLVPFLIGATFLLVLGKGGDAGWGASGEV